jgi:hypothetical protein
MADNESVVLKNSSSYDSGIDEDKLSLLGCSIINLLRIYTIWS